MAVFNPFDPQLRTDPYPIYRALREEEPLHWNQIMQVWVLSRYDDVFAVLRDHARFSSERTRATNPLVQQMESFRETLGPMGTAPTVLSVDPPAHTRMRNLINKAFTPRVVERIRPRIEAIATELLAGVPEGDAIEVVSTLAQPLPMIVIAETLGVPVADRERFKGWSDDIAGTLGGPFLPQDVLDRAALSANQIADYFREQIALRRAEPTDDLLGALTSAQEQGDLLSEDELISTCILLLVAGNETTTNLIGNGMLALLRNPDQERRLRAEPALMESAVDEMLRYDGPAQMTSRVVTTEMELRGQRLEPGQVVICLLGAANRDPEFFPDPDRFDIGRPSSRHAAFGYGIHYCLGAPLALAETQVALETLLRRLPKPELAGAPQWTPSFVLRGLSELSVRSGD